MSNGSQNTEDGRHARSYLDKVSSFVEAYSIEDDETIAVLFPQICDNPGFDEALAEVAAGIDHDNFDIVDFRYGLLSMSSITCAPYQSTSGSAEAIIQLFFVPLSGVLSDIEAISGDTETLTAIARTFIDTGLASRDSSIVASGSLLDPPAAASVTAGTVRLALRMIAPVLTGRMESDNLGEALASVFGTDERSERPHGRGYAHRLLPVARIITPADGVHREDPLSSYRIDMVAEEALTLKRWHRTMAAIVPAGIVVGEPCSIMRGSATMAANMVEHAFLGRALRLGSRSIPDFDEVQVSRGEDTVSITGRHGREVYGPVQVPTVLFSSDLTMITEYIDGLSSNVTWEEASKPPATPPRPH